MLPHSQPQKKSATINDEQIACGIFIFSTQLLLAAAMGGREPGEGGRPPHGPMIHDPSEVTVTNCHNHTQSAAHDDDVK